MRLVIGVIAMIGCTVAANLLLKLGAHRVPSPLLGGMLSWTSFGGLAVFGAAGLLYAWVLKWLPLNVAQSFAAAQFISVIVAARILLAEEISIWRWVGIGMIASGIFVVGLSMQTWK